MCPKIQALFSFEFCIDRSGDTRKVGRQMYTGSQLSNYGNSESPQLIRPSPPLERPSSKTVGNINRGNINQNAIVRDPTPTGLTRNDSDSLLVQRNDPRSLQRNDSADLVRRRTPVLKRHVTADDYLQNINLHHDYQGRRGHMKVHTKVEDRQIRYVSYEPCFI